MSIFTIKGYKVNSQNATMTAPSGQKYKLRGVGIPLHYWDVEKCYINLGTINNPCSVNGYRQPIPEDLELVGEYLSQFQDKVEQWTAENQRWFSKTFQCSEKVQVAKVPTQWDYYRTWDVVKYFHPRWVKYHEEYGWDYNLSKGLNAPTDSFMNEDIESDLKSYQRLQWINDPKVIEASLVEAKEMFRSNIQPLIEEFIEKIESGDHARECKEQTEWEEQRRIEKEARDARSRASYAAKQEKAKAEQAEKIKIRKEFLDKVKALFSQVPNSRVFITPYSWDEITIEVKWYESEDTRIFNITNKAGVLRMCSEYSSKPVRKNALD